MDRGLLFVLEPTEFIVTSLLMGRVCLLSQGRFEEPVRPWVRLTYICRLSGVVRHRQSRRSVLATRQARDHGLWQPYSALVCCVNSFHRQNPRKMDYYSLTNLGGMEG